MPPQLRPPERRPPQLNDLPLLPEELPQPEELELDEPLFHVRLELEPVSLENVPLPNPFLLARPPPNFSLNRLVKL